MAGIGGTVADVLRVVELLMNDTQTASGEIDEAPAILALVQAQHYFETLCATFPDILQSTVTLSTTANTEKTTWTAALLRLDAVWLLDAAGSPIHKLARIEEVGGHVPSLPWPLTLTSAPTGTGVPYGYYGNMESFYWLPLPAGVSTLRLYGFLEKARFADRTSDFNYPYRCHLAFAQFASKLMAIGVDDATIDLDRLAAQVFSPLIKQLRKFDRSEPHARVYTEFHTT